MTNQGQNNYVSISFIITFSILGLTFIVMILGVYLSSTHQGYSCKTWPLCPNGFNFPSEDFFLEHYHRLLVLILSITLISFTVSAFIKNSLKKIRIKLLLAVLLLIIQIILGWVMIETKLNPYAVAIHLAIGLSIFAMILVVLISINKDLKWKKNDQTKPS